MYLINSGCQNPAIKERWIRRIDDLKRKRHYEAFSERN